MLGRLQGFPLGPPAAEELSWLLLWALGACPLSSRDTGIWLTMTLGFRFAPLTMVQPVRNWNFSAFPGSGSPVHPPINCQALLFQGKSLFLCPSSHGHMASPRWEHGLYGPYRCFQGRGKLGADIVAPDMCAGYIALYCTGFCPSAFSPAASKAAKPSF